MSDQSKEIKKLRDEGTSWAETFRQIIPSFPAGQDHRMLLFRELREAYGFDMGTLLELGAWNYWEDNGKSDEEVNLLMNDRNPEKPDPSPSH